MRRTTAPMLAPIRRGTTPTIRLPTPIDVDIIKGGFVTFEQRGAVVFEKPLSDASVQYERGAIAVDLSQEETLKLTTADVCKVQARFILLYGKIAASGMAIYPVSDILKEGEI